MPLRLDGDPTFATSVQTLDDAPVHHSYVDDSVFQVLSLPTDTIGKHTVCLSNFDGGPRQLWLHPQNLPGKTEVVLDIRRVGARNIRAEVFSRKDTKLTFSVASATTPWKSHTHLGTQTSAKASRAPVVTARVPAV